MENRSVGPEDRNESALYQHAPAMRKTASDERTGESSLDGEELNLLVEFFQLLDQWDREVVQ
jgi:hypothetical protein